jgi:DNA invertase Pin-like site-specific DNA recombinase
MKNVFAYIRTSNNNLKAVENSDSKARQLRRIRRYTRPKGWKVTKVFHDCVTGDSGMDLSARVEFHEMLREMAENEIDVFCVETAERFSRSILTAAVLTEELKRRGIKCMDASTGQDLTNEDNPEQKMVKDILLVISTFHKQMTVEKLRSGKLRASAEGKYVGGIKPFPANEDEHNLLECLKELKAARRDAEGKRYTKRRITEEVAARGFVNRNGTQYSEASIGRIINQFM